MVKFHPPFGLLPRQLAHSRLSCPAAPNQNGASGLAPRPVPFAFLLLIGNRVGLAQIRGLGPYRAVIGPAAVSSALHCQGMTL